MATVKDILSSKDPTVHAVLPDTSVEAALKIMANEGIGALIVKEGDEILGIFSERDFARKSLSIQGFQLNVPVKELMTSPVYFVKPGQSIEECMTLMTEKRIRHLPVLEEGQLIGVVSIRDVIKWLMADKTYEIQELERFVNSSPEEEL